MADRYALVGARSDLSDAAEIIALMAQDLNDLRREHDGVTHENLIEIGWTKDQLDAFFLRAIDAAGKSFSDVKAAAESPFGRNFVRNKQTAPFLEFDARMRHALAAHARIVPHPDANEVA